MAYHTFPYLEWSVGVYGYTECFRPDLMMIHTQVGAPTQLAQLASPHNERVREICARPHRPAWKSWSGLSESSLEWLGCFFITDGDNLR